MSPDIPASDYVEDSHQFRTDDSEALDHDEAAALNEIASPENEREDALLAGVIHGDEIATGQGTHADTWDVNVGIDVVASCGHKVGEVVDVRDEYVIVEKGFFNPEDIYVPKSAIANVDDHHLHLNVSKQAVKDAHWEVEPFDDDEVPPPQVV
jgi:hypothetical protein